jgi:hypothetical protein
MDHKQLKPGEWRIEKLGDGTWEFKIRYQLELRDILPNYIRRNFVMAIFVYMTFFAPFFIGLGSSVNWNAFSLLIVCPMAALFAATCFMLVWPLRFMNAGGSSQWAMNRKLRYKEGNRVVTLKSFPSGRFSVNSGNVYPLHCLETLKIDRKDEVYGRVGLKLTGDLTEGERLLSWPGFPEHDAIKIRAALLDLIEAHESVSRAG